MSARLLVLCLMICSATGLCAENPSPKNSALYDSDPEHLWNQLNKTLFLRTAPDGKEYGLGQLDILFWQNTKHLLTQPSHREALRILDSFINSHGEKLIRDPLKRALLQRDLWQLFDWTAWPWRNESFSSEREALQSRLAIIIRRLALTTNQISVLPDTYANAEATGTPVDLPGGLFKQDGDWLSVGANGYGPMASTHMEDFGGRSIFLVMVRFPEGREQAIAYLSKLREVENPWTYSRPPESDRPVPVLNPALPQFPSNTEWALVRRLCVIDKEGHVQPTSLIESIQVRRYRSVPAVDATGVRYDRESAIAAQRFTEFDLDRRHGAALKAVNSGEKEFQFVHFRSMGFDPLECTSDPSRTCDYSKSRTDTLRTCTMCHSAPGIFSVVSYTRFSPPATEISATTVEEEVTATLNWKHRQYDWGLLQGLWRQVH